MHLYYTICMYSQSLKSGFRFLTQNYKCLKHLTLNDNTQNFLFVTY